MKTVKVLVTLLLGMSSLSSGVAAAAEPDFTMKATADGVVVTGKDFTGTAAEASFDSTKGVLILRGTSKKRASVTREYYSARSLHEGVKEDTVSARVIEIMLKTRSVRLIGVDGT